MEAQGEGNSSKDGVSDENSGRVGRRSFFKLTGAATGSLLVGAASGSAAAAESGYGADGYGEGGFGDSSDDGQQDEEDSTTDEAPEVDRLRVTESSPPNPHAELTVEWVVSDAGGNLESAEIDVYEGRRVVDAETVSVSGDAASGSTGFRIKKGAGSTYTVTLSVHDAAGAEDSASDSVRA